MRKPALRRLHVTALAATLCVTAAMLLAPATSRADLIEGSVFQPTGENLMVSPPSGWRMAYMNGTPDGDYVVDFLPANEAFDSWREGYMSVQRKSFPEQALLDNIRARGLSLPSMAIAEVMQTAQRNCTGRFVAMSQKDSLTNNIPTSVSGGFCDRGNGAGPYGEGSLVAVFEGKQRMFLVQFGWRPSTPDELRQLAYRITPEKLQQYLNLINAAALCGGPDQGRCPR